MKINKISLPLTLCVAAVAVVGCSKQESAPPAVTQTTPPPAPRIETTQKAMENTAAEVKTKNDAAVAEVAKTAEAIKAAEPTTPPPVAATPPASPSSSPAQGILQRVQALVAEQKYPEALSVLSELSTTSLTVEQQNLVTQLKTQISNAMASKAGNDGLKSVGGFLKK